MELAVIWYWRKTTKGGHMRCSMPNYFYCWYMKWNLNNLNGNWGFISRRNSIKNKYIFPFLPKLLPDNVWAYKALKIFLVNFKKNIFYIRNSKENFKTLQQNIFQKKSYFMQGILFRLVKPTGKANIQEGLQVMGCQVYPSRKLSLFLLHCKDHHAVGKQVWKRNKTSTDNYRST